MKITSVLIIQILLLIFNVCIYKRIRDEREIIEENGYIKVLILQIKDKGKYGIKYNVKYQDRVYYNIVGLNNNLRENTYNTSDFYYDKNTDSIIFENKDTPVFNVMRILFVLSFLLWFLPKEKFCLKW